MAEENNNLQDINQEPASNSDAEPSTTASEPEAKPKTVKGVKQLKHRRERHWFAIHTYSGYEDAVARYLKQRVESLGMTDKIFDVVVPKEKKIKIKDGRKSIIEEKVYPGYVLVDMLMTEDSWYVVRNTPRVTGFVGAEGTSPTPLSKDEVEFLLARMRGDESTQLKIDYRVDDPVRIIDGPFKDYDAKISEIDETRGKLKVLVPLFG